MIKAISSEKCTSICCRSCVPLVRKHSRQYTASSDPSQIPDFSKYFPATPISELSTYIGSIWSAYPQRSKYVNQMHYYQNKKVLVEQYLQKQPHAVSLMQLSQYYDDSKKLTSKKVINSGKFAKEELVVRMAHKLKVLQDLPFNVVNNFHFLQVYESYYNIFDRFRKFPTIKTLEDNERFAEFLYRILNDFNSLNLPHLIMGALECRILDLYPQEQLDELVSSCLRARISRRLIVEEHLSVTSNYMSGKEENTLIFGDIIQECHASDYLLKASKMCEDFIKDMFFNGIKLPQFILQGDTDLKFYFMPTHLKYLFGECLRNSYEATVKEYIRKGLSEPDPIVVTIVKNDRSFLFRISDRGGGILHDDRTIWSFGKSKELAKRSLDNFHKLTGAQCASIYDCIDEIDANGTYSFQNPTTGRLRYTSLESAVHSNLTKGKYKMQFSRPLLGLLGRSSRYRLGIGLAMCKVYAEYWNGDLTVHSIQGYGTDTVIKLGNLHHNPHKVQLDRV